MNKGFEIEVKRFIDAAHQLPDSKDLITKKCANLHGHTYYIKVLISGVNDSSGMVIDFSGIKNIIDELDHKYINDIFKASMVWEKEPTTAENIAKFICLKINAIYTHIRVEKVMVCEGYKGESSNWVTYYNPYE
jgi:6-pyruvoyltetrahydropterin/6-carboxytetrahydropterin synthase